MDKLFCGVLLAGVLLTVGLPFVHGEEVISLPNSTPCNTTAQNGTIVLAPPFNGTTCNITINRTEASSTYTTVILHTIVLHGGDSLDVYDGEVPLLNLEGSRDALVLMSFSNETYLVLTPASNNSHSIVMATYNTTDCNIEQTISGSSIIESPMYIHDKGAFTCNYLFRTADSVANKLALAFTILALSNATLNITYPVNRTITGTDLPPDVYSPDTIQMTLSLPKSADINKFWASVTSIANYLECGQTIVVNNSLNINLNVSESHPVPFDCRIVLKAATGSSLMVNITSLDLASHGDLMEMVDGASLFGGKILATFTSPSPGFLALSGENQMLLRMVPGILKYNRSLVMDIRELSSVSHWYHSGNFTIQPSPGSDMVTQYFLLEVEPSFVVQFDLAAQTMNKTYDYNISLYDGGQTSEPLLVTFSSAVRLPVMSSGNKLLVVACLSNTSQPLKVTFSSKQPGCDQVTSAAEGTLQLSTSSGVPSMCQWTVTAPPNSAGTIVLDMTTVQLLGNASLSVYSGVKGSGGSLVAYLTNVSSLLSAPLPSVAVPASQWAQVVWSSGNSSNLTSVAVSVHFHLTDTLCGGAITTTHGRLHSPSFPNQYPLNAICQWTFPLSDPGRLLFFDFPQFQLAPNHSVVIEEMKNGSSQRVGVFNGTAALPDVLYASNNTNTVTFSAQLPQTVTVSNQVAQGFDIQYWTLNCGGSTNKTNGSYTVSPANATLCVWFIQLPNKTGDNLNIVNLTLRFKKGASPPFTEAVTVYDGDTLRHPPLTLNTSKQGDTATALSRYNSIIIVFNITTKTPAPKDGDIDLGLVVDYTTFSCNKSMQCHNGVCIHPDWICNGQDNCGDNTDEQNCIIPPNPPKPSPRSGTKPGIVVLLFFVGLLLGLLLAVVIPRIIRRFRTNRYATFRNEPAVA